MTALEQLIVSSCGITELIGALESETLEYADFTRNQITTVSYEAARLKYFEYIFIFTDQIEKN